MERYKGVNILVRAFERCQERYPNIRLHLAGWGGLQSQLNQRCTENASIYYHGAVYGEEKARLFEDCDVVVVPSMWLEVFGIVVVEAFAYGKPVIASRIGGIPELVQEGRTGFLVTAEDEQALQRAMCMVASNPAVVTEMRGACFEAARGFSSEVVADAYLAMYHR
jgi:glycosyltransferase involved in cell wall biosynthesis